VPDDAEAGDSPVPLPLGSCVLSNPNASGSAVAAVASRLLRVAGVVALV
jgi:hypothetical protein